MNNSADHMLAINFLSSGGPEVLEIQKMRTPQAQSGEVLIQVHAAGVNRPDILQRMGVYDPPKGASTILGLEVAGTVQKLGVGVNNFSIGDKVVALTNGGGYAQYVNVPAGQVLPLPKNYSMIEGAALPETLFTVRQTLIDRAMLKTGQTVLIHGGASGIGAVAIQMAKLIGATPYTTTSSSEKSAYAKSMGAAATINYLKEDFVNRIDILTKGRGVDVVLDIVGGEYLDRHLQCIAYGGTIIQLAMLGGAKAEINLSRLLMKHVTLFGSTLRPQSSEKKADIAASLLSEIWPALENSTIKKPRIKIYPLEQAAAAHTHMLTPQHFGKIVLNVIQ